MHLLARSRIIDVYQSLKEDQMSFQRAQTVGNDILCMQFLARSRIIDVYQSLKDDQMSFQGAQTVGSDILY